MAHCAIEFCGGPPEAAGAAINPTSPPVGLMVSIATPCSAAPASVDAARFLLLRDVEAVAHAVREHGEASIEQRINNRRGQAFAVNLAVRAVDILNAAAGGNGLQMSNPIQRAWRDVNAVGRHVSLNWDSVGSMYGQMALGLEPRGQY